MDFPRIRSTFGVTPYAPGRKRPIERDEEDTIADIPNPEMMQKEPEIYDRPFPPGVAMQEAFDDMLQRRIVDPLAKAGYEDVGAGFAAIPSAAHSMIVPQSEFDVAGTLIPLPGVAKLMKKGKFRKISKAMHVEDPENAAEIIAKQASKEGGPVNLDPEAQKIAKVKQEKFLRKQTDDPTKKELSFQEGLTFKGGFANYDNPEEILKQYNDAIKSPPNNTYVGSNIAGSFTVDPAKGVGPARQLPIDPSHMAKTNHIGSGVELGNPDPLAWMDIKKGVTRDWLINTKGTPRLIETQSDLIAHDDYMSNLMPGDRVVLHIYTDNNRINRIINPGGPSVDRVLNAAQKLAKAGIDVKIVKNSPDTLKTLPNHDVGDINAIKLKDSGIKFEERNLALDEAQESRLRKMLGLESKYKKDLDDAETDKMVSDRFPLESVDPNHPQRERLDRIKSSLSKIDELMKKLKEAEKPKTPLKSVEPPKSEKEKWSKILREDDEIDAEKNQQAIDEALKRIQDRKNKPKIVEPPKPPKGDPEASLPRQPDKFSAIRSQLDVAPSRMDERGKAFGDVGQSEFTPYDRPNVIREDVPRRNYVESEMGPSVADRTFAPPGGKAFQEIYMDKKPAQLQNDEMLMQHILGGPASDAYDLQKQMYKGRPSHEAEQAKLFPKVKEAVKGKAQPKSGPGYTQGKWYVKDLAGNEMTEFGTYDYPDDAWEGIRSILETRPGYDFEKEDRVHDYIVEKRKKK